MPSSQRKILSLDALVATRDQARAQGQRVVHCHGCFDIVHPGHIRYLQFARSLGDVLVVSITGDSGVAKGADRPYIPQELRCENLAALEIVDWVAVDSHPTAVELLTRLKPDVYVKGQEYARSQDPRFLRERAVVEQAGGRVAFHSDEVVFSSTALLANMRRDTALDNERLVALCQRRRIDRHAVQQVINRFADLRVVVVGDVVSEKCVLCEAGAAVGDDPVLTAQVLGETTYVGGAAGVALQMSMLGVRCTLFGAVGADDASRAFATRLQDAGVDAHLAPARTGLVERTTFTADGDKLFKSTRGGSAPLDSTAEDALASAATDELRGADLLVWCDEGFGVVTPSLVAALTAIVTSKQRVVGVAGGPRGQLASMLNTHLLCAAEPVFRESLHDRSSALPAVVWHALHATAGRAALVSLRKRGMLSFDAPSTNAESTGLTGRLQSEFVPPLTPQCLDLMGASAASWALASLAVASGSTLPLAAYLAAAGGALVAARFGADPCSLDELLVWLDQRPEWHDMSRFSPDAPAAPRRSKAANMVAAAL